MKIEGQTFNGVEVDLEAHEFENCTFNQARLFFSGAKRVCITNCQFNDCGIGYRGAAENTLNCLMLLHQASDQRGKWVVEGFLDGVRKGFPPFHSEDLPHRQHQSDQLGQEEQVS